MTFVQTRHASRRYFTEVPPVPGAVPQWIERGANFVAAYAEPGAGDTLEQVTRQECLLYLPDAPATVATDAETMDCPAGSVVVVPPGHQRLSIGAPGKVLRVFSSAEDIAGLARNADVYADGATEVARVEAAPPPASGWRLRCHRLADYRDRPMRMFRSANLMLNIFDIDGPRDVENLTPHAHDDFEQGSFAMAGEWVHSLRYPWSRRLADWREDEHVRMGSPSIMIIPAQVIHTSRCESRGRNQLVDIFSPPRRDFIDMGLVCNEADYAEPAKGAHVP